MGRRAVLRPRPGLGKTTLAGIIANELGVDKDDIGSSAIDKSGGSGGHTDQSQ